MKYLIFCTMIGMAITQCTSNVFAAEIKVKETKITQIARILNLDARCFENGQFDRDLGDDDLDCGNDFDLAIEAL